ncbi:OsmC family protein [Paenibacillus sp. NFR01]|uniref:OsmC family protein n=1 Tax=Paenibacillus sp. NFR01 TaxID=1566279 RepID=UPI0008CAB85F|nr:OsmC family protein [Paenibacillus sp. NFR01]SET45555.1 Uncharacterized OsmC-related protein [Paenibacillus sp. NFR01]
MANIKLVATSTTEGLTSTVKAGTQQFYIDEPLSQGGGNRGPNPLQALLGALIGCENVIARTVAKETGFDLQGISFKAAGELDLRGLAGDTDVRTYFDNVEVRVEVVTTETEARILELQQETDRRCPIFGTLKAAGVRMNPVWTKAEPAVQIS